jgi:hypothetical protein
MQSLPPQPFMRVAEPLPASPEACGAWQGRRGVPAWALSFALHFSALAVLGLTTAAAPQGASEEAVRSAGIVLVQRTAGKAEYFSDSDSSDSAAASTASSRVIAATPNPFPDHHDPPAVDGPQLPTAQDALPGSQSPVGIPSADQLPGTGGKGGRPLGRGGDRGAETQVFGVKGRGTRFVYVFDRSASMSVNSNTPLNAAKRELIASLQSLDSVHQFQIVFYNHQPSVMNLFGGQRPGLVFADDRGKKLAADYVGGVLAHGNTDHMPALRLALQMRPDVIFFLTDADPPELTRSDFEAIRRLNRGTVINAIEFGVGPASARHNFLKQLAAEHDGQYGYVDVTRLPRP